MWRILNRRNAESLEANIDYETYAEGGDRRHGVDFDDFGKSVSDVAEWSRRFDF